MTDANAWKIILNLFFVFQSSNLGQAYVTDGGIGENRITIVVEAQNTTIFRHRARIFGIID